MSLIKQPGELQPKTTIAALIYGQPGIGKTTLACSSPNPVMFDFDCGITRINGAFQVPTVQISQWEDVSEAIEEMGTMFNSIIIDTVGKMLAYMEDYIKRTQPKMKQSDGSLSLKGYGVRKNMFNEFKNSLITKGINVIFVAHDNETKQGEDVKIRPLISGSSANDLMQDIDLVGYMEAQGRERTISFDSTDRFYGKNTCNMPPVIRLKNLTDVQGNIVAKNDFLTQVLAQFFSQQETRRQMAQDYEDLLSVIDAKVEFINDATSCNEVVAEVLAMQHIWNSKLVASTKISAKAKSLGLHLNDGRYE